MSYSTQDIAGTAATAVAAGTSITLAQVNMIVSICAGLVAVAAGIYTIWRGWNKDRQERRRGESQ